MLRSFAAIPFATLALATFALAQSPGGTPRRESLSLEASCRATFDALVAGDLGPLEGLLPTSAELEALYFAQLPEDSAERLAEAQARLAGMGGADGLRAEVLGTVREHLVAARREAGELFDLRDARFVGATSEPGSAWRIPGFEVTAAEFHVWSRGRLFAFGAQDLVRFGAGWTFADGVHFRGERALVTPESIEDAERTRDQRNALEAQVLESDRLLHEAQAHLDRMAGERNETEGALAVAREAIAERDAQLDGMEAMREELVAALRDAQALEAENRRLFLAGEARRERILRLVEQRAGTEAEPNDPRAAAWPGPDRASAQWRTIAERDLETAVSMDLDQLDLDEVAAYLGTATGVPVLVTPGAYALLEGLDEEAWAEVIPRGERAAEILENLAADLGLERSLVDRHVVLSSRDELERLTAENAGEARPEAPELEQLLRRERRFVDLDPGTIAEFMGLIAEATATDIWISATFMGDIALDHGFGSEESLSMWTVLQLLSVHALLECAVHGDVLYLSPNPFDPGALPELPADVRDIVPAQVVSVDAPARPLTDLLSELSAASGLTITADPAVLALPFASPYHALSVDDVPLELALRLIALDVSFDARWRARDGGVVLMIEE